VVPAVGITQLAELDRSRTSAWCAFGDLSTRLDFLVVDTALGIADRCCSSLKRPSKCWWSSATSRRSPMPALIKILHGTMACVSSACWPISLGAWTRAALFSGSSVAARFLSVELIMSIDPEDPFRRSTVNSVLL
jgi:hypothetical protein